MITFAFSDLKKVNLEISRSWVLRNCNPIGTRLCNCGLENVYESDHVLGAIEKKTEAAKKNTALSTAKRAETVRNLDNMKKRLNSYKRLISEQGVASA